MCMHNTHVHVHVHACLGLPLSEPNVFLLCMYSNPVRILADVIADTGLYPDSCRVLSQHKPLQAWAAAANYYTHACRH